MITNILLIAILLILCFTAWLSVVRSLKVYARLSKIEAYTGDVCATLDQAVLELGEVRRLISDTTVPITGNTTGQRYVRARDDM